MEFRVGAAILLGGISLAIVLSSFYLAKPSLTGLATAVYTQEVNFEVSKPTSLALKTFNSRPIRLASFSLSGEVVGEGAVFILLLNERGERRLVFTNLAGIKTNYITGLFAANPKSHRHFSISSKLEDEESMKELLLKDKALRGKGSFQRLLFNACIETCALDWEGVSFNLLIGVEPGTRFILKNINYLTK